MEGALRSAGADENGRLPALAEHFRAQIGLAAVDQTADAEPVVLEGLVIRLEREVVVDPGGHVAPVRRRQNALRRGFEIHDTEPVFRFCQLLRAETRKKRTGGEELQEPAAGGRHNSVTVSRHTRVNKKGRPLPGGPF